MDIYPVPVEVTQARIQLLVDQNAKAPPTTINNDVKAVSQAKTVAEEAALQQVRPEETALVDVRV